MKYIVTFVLVALIGYGAYVWLADRAEAPTVTDESVSDVVATTSQDSFILTPISHATFVLEWGDVVIYNDPVGDPAVFMNQPPADIVLISDIHGDHLSTSTLTAVLGNAELVVPQAVADLLPADLAERAIIMNNGEQTTVAGISVRTIPMYNLPIDGDDYRHVVGRGNGYILETNEERIYIAGDTEDIPEMRDLTDIDVAFIPMNVPYTMDIYAAADGVLAFAPGMVYPYHYRGPDGLSDVAEFKRLVNEVNPDIEVRLEEWYPDREE